MKIDLSRYRSTFFEEAAEHLTSMERGLLELEGAPQDPEPLNCVFRVAHSIKGSSGMLGMQDVSEFAHDLEGLLECLRSGKMQATPATLELLLRAKDTLESLLAAERDGTPAPGDAQAVRTALREMLSGVEAAHRPEHAEADAAAAHRPEHAEADAAAAPGSAQPQVWCIRFTPGREILARGLDPLVLLRNLADLGEVEGSHVDTSRLPPLAEIDPERCDLAWLVVLRTTAEEAQLREAFAFAEGECTLEIRKGNRRGDSPDENAEPDELRAPRTLGDSSIRVPTERVDSLINLVGELVIAQSMLNAITAGLPTGQLADLAEAIDRMQRRTHELQEQMLAVRMLPVATVFDRFPRVARDVAIARGKRVRIEVVGEETELDKTVIEAIADPLLHMVRNAVDHGIEDPDTRKALGKPETGIVRLTAYHESGCVVIEVQDDGRGLDAARIRERAVASGLLAAGADPSDDELHSLVLRPGFSTAREVSDISGRGVGLDVVASNVTAINGRLTIASRPGKGTTFRIQLPLTLAILDGLAVSVGNHVYLLPLLSVVESLSPAADDVLSMTGVGEVVRVRGDLVPLVRLGQVLGADRAARADRSLVVIVEHEGRRLGLQVDALCGQQQAVIKNLETNYRRVEGLIGATILGDGTVAFILDVHGIARLAEAPVAGARPTRPAGSLTTSEGV